MYKNGGSVDVESFAEVRSEESPVVESTDDRKNENSDSDTTYTDTKKSDSGKVNINLDGSERLETLPGIGKSKAAAIIAYREKNGPFGSIADICRVPGIKDGIFGRIKDKIEV